jgi:hypothetical protein
MSVALALDLLVAGLLVATIAYAVVLNRRLSQLRGGSAHMERMINDFYQATTRAEAGLTALREVTGRPDSEVIKQVESLTKLHDELEFIVSRAEQQGARLEELIRDSRGKTANASPSAARGMAPDSGLDAELFGDQQKTPGDGSRPRRLASAPKVAAMQEVR